MAFSLATEKPYPEVQHELPLPGDLYLRKVDDNGPRIIVEFKYIAVDHFVVSDGVYSEALRESVKKNGSIINWTPELPSSARAFLKNIGDNFELVKVNYNRKGVKTTSEWRDKWKAEAEGRVASYREAYGSAKALRVLSVTVFPTGHTRVDLVADVPGNTNLAAPRHPRLRPKPARAPRWPRRCPRRQGLRRRAAFKRENEKRG